LGDGGSVHDRQHTRRRTGMTGCTPLKVEETLNPSLRKSLRISSQQTGLSLTSVLATGMLSVTFDRPDLQASSLGDLLKIRMVYSNSVRILEERKHIVEQILSSTYPRTFLNCSRNT
jgi:hypothetical protein